MRLLILFIVFFIITPTTAIVVPPEIIYYYDKNLPLNEEVELVHSGRLVDEYLLKFDTVFAQRIEASLYIPKTGRKPYPVVLYLHGVGMNRKLPSLAQDLFAQEGYAVFSISVQYTNERKKEKRLLSPHLFDMKYAFIQTVLDYRRGIDYLEKRADIDTNRIAVLGLSLGAMLGSILTGVDERIRCAVLAVGGGNFPLLLRKSIFSLLIDLSKLNVKKEHIQYATSLIDPINFAPNSKGTPILMVNGREDELIPVECAQQLYDSFAEPKHIIWYEGGHVPSMDKIMKLAKETLEWLGLYLKPKKLPIVENNTVPTIEWLKIKPTEKIKQGQPIRLYAKAKDVDNNIIFVKVYIAGAASYVLLYDDGKKGVDEIKNDGIYSGRSYIPYTSLIGETKIESYAVDYNGEVSRPQFQYIDILPYEYPKGSPPQIIKVEIEKEIELGKKYQLKVYVTDPDNDIKEVEGKLLEFGLPFILEKEKEGVYRYEVEIPHMPELLLLARVYHLSIRAVDKTRRKSERKIVEIKLSPNK